MALPIEDGEYYDEGLDESPEPEKGKRKSTKGRQLMRWDGKHWISTMLLC